MSENLLRGEFPIELLSKTISAQGRGEPAFGTFAKLLWRTLDIPTLVFGGEAYVQHSDIPFM